MPESTGVGPSFFGPSFFVGAYTADMGGEATGIAVLDSRADGSLALRGGVAAAESPSYLASDGGVLFAVAEATGRVTRFARGDGETLRETASVDSGGQAPCQLTVVGESLLVANYTSGTVGVIDRGSSEDGSSEDGAFDLVQVLPGSGSGPHEAQDAPHAHATHALSDGIVLSADLGADLIHRHTLTDGRLDRVSSIGLEPGTGPRDFCEPAPGILWVLGELSCELLVFAVTAAGLDLLSTTGIPGAEPGDHAAGIAVSDDRRFVYVGLRGSNRVAWFAASTDARTLTAAGHVPSAGDWPRHLVVEGNFLHVANQLSSTVSTFDTKQNGHPELVREPEPVPSPTFLLRA